jgi:hypothetical protein
MTLTILPEILIPQLYIHEIKLLFLCLGMFRKYQKCAIPGCLHRFDPFDMTSNVKFFCFPRNDERCLEWLQAIKNKQLQNTALSTVRNCYSVCEDHFETCMFQTVQRVKLNRNARPTLLLPSKIILHCIINFF